jgi:hypothetical protein
MLRTWLVRFTIELTLSIRSFRVRSATALTSAWPPSRTSVPTPRAILVTSSANAESVSTIRLMIWANAAASPFGSTDARTRETGDLPGSARLYGVLAATSAPMRAPCSARHWAAAHCRYGTAAQAEPER